MSKDFKSCKVLVYVKSCLDEGELKEKICVELETTKWSRTEDRPYIWKRTDRCINALKYRVCSFDKQKNCIDQSCNVDTPIKSSLYAKNGVIHFKQGYFLKIEGLIPPPSNNDEDPSILRAESKHKTHRDLFSARNIHAETIFEVEP